MNDYTIYWLDGYKEFVSGDSIPDAYRRAGYGSGALRAVDFIADGKDDNYQYINGNWIKKQ